MSELKSRILEETNAALKGGDKPRLAVLRLIRAAITQREVDERIELCEQDVLAVLDKMAKQRRESIQQFTAAKRNDLSQQEAFELEIIKSYLPEQLSDDELKSIIAQIIDATGATSMRDMGKVMGQLMPKIQGRADMTQVSSQIKSLLS